MFFQIHPTQNLHRQGQSGFHSFPVPVLLLIVKSFFSCILMEFPVFLFVPIAGINYFLLITGPMCPSFLMSILPQSVVDRVFCGLPLADVFWQCLDSLFAKPSALQTAGADN